MTIDTNLPTYYSDSEDELCTCLDAGATIDPLGCCAKCPFRRCSGSSSNTQQLTKISHIRKNPIDGAISDTITIDTRKRKRDVDNGVDPLINRAKQLKMVSKQITHPN